MVRAARILARASMIACLLTAGAGHADDRTVPCVRVTFKIVPPDGEALSKVYAQVTFGPSANAKKMLNVKNGIVSDTFDVCVLRARGQQKGPDDTTIEVFSAEDSGILFDYTETTQLDHDVSISLTLRRPSVK